MKTGMYGVSFRRTLAPFLFTALLTANTIVARKVEPLNIQECIDVAKSELIQSNTNVIDTLYFTPDDADRVKKILVGLIESETTSIRAALFRLTDKDITAALIRAQERGIDIELVVDSGALSLAYYSKVHQIGASGVPVYVYQSMSLRDVQTYKSIMHQKTFVFKNSIGGPIVLFGSLNPTHAAFHGNEEAVQVRNNPHVVTGFNAHFEKLKNRSHCYEIVRKAKQRSLISERSCNKVIANGLRAAKRLKK